MPKVKYGMFKKTHGQWLKAKTNLKSGFELLLKYGKKLFLTKNQSFCNDIVLLA